MVEPLFVAQAKLERWVDDGEVTFADDILTLLAQKRSFRLAPAVLVRSLIDGEDTQALVGRIVSLADLEALGAEHFEGTVILGETGYQCEEGFAGEEVLGGAAGAAFHAALGGTAASSAAVGAAGASSAAAAATRTAPGGAPRASRPAAGGAPPASGAAPGSAASASSAVARPPPAGAPAAGAAPGSAAPASSAVARPPPAVAPAAGEQSDMDLLEAFLLEHL